VEVGGSRFEVVPNNNKKAQDPVWEITQAIRPEAWLKW
jgi:hypothetical protein